MKSILTNIVTSLIVWGITSIISGTLFKSWINRLIFNHQQAAFWLIILSLGGIVGLLVYIIRLRRVETPSLSGLKINNKNLKRYSVVFVDDMFSDSAALTDFKDKFDNYNILLLPHVSNVRTLIGFDVIILDIVGAGGCLGDTKPLISELHDICPYKYVIALTSNAGALDDIKEICHVEQKPIISTSKRDTNHFNNQLVDKVRRLLDEAFKALDTPEVYWKDVEQRLPENILLREEIKTKYKHHVIDSGLYSKRLIKQS